MICDVFIGINHSIARMRVLFFYLRNSDFSCAPIFFWTNIYFRIIVSIKTIYQDKYKITAKIVALRQTKIPLRRTWYNIYKWYHKVIYNFTQMLFLFVIITLTTWGFWEFDSGINPEFAQFRIPELSKVFEKLWSNSGISLIPEMLRFRNNIEVFEK